MVVAARRWIALLSFIGLAALIWGCGAKTNGADYITKHSAILYAQINWSPGEQSVYWFEYRAAGAGSWQKTESKTSAPGPDSFQQAVVSEVVDGLEQGTSYEYRLCGYLLEPDQIGSEQSPVCFNAEGGADGDWTRFKTLGQALPPAAAGCDLFAAPGGDDRAAGTLAAPFESAEQLIDSLAPGEVGCLRAGTYRDSTFSFSTPGTALTAYGSESVTLKGTIKIKPEAKGTVIAGLRLDGRSGSEEEGPNIYADDTVLAYNEITNNHTGICVQVARWSTSSRPNERRPEDVVIYRNRIHDCGELPSTNHHHGIYISNAIRTIVQDNWIYDNADRGVQLYPRAIGSLIIGNVIDSNKSALNFSCDEHSCSKDNVASGNVLTRSWDRNVYANSQGASPDGSNVLEGNCVWSPDRDPLNNGGIDPAPAFFHFSGNLRTLPRYADRASHNYRLKAASGCLPLFSGTNAAPPSTPPAGFVRSALAGDVEFGSAG